MGVMNVLESTFQARLIPKLEELFPGCLILKNDPGYRQGIPDLLILFRRRWALLEVKKSANARHRPNQDYYVEMGKRLSFAAFIYPENEEEVLNALQRALQPRRTARVS